MLIAVPAPVVTEMRPVVAPAGTFTTTFVAVSDTMVAGVPLNAAPMAPVRLWPMMVTEDPAAPDLGATLSISGVTVVVIRPMLLLP